MTIESFLSFWQHRDWLNIFLELAILVVLAWVVYRLSWTMAGPLVRLGRSLRRDKSARPERLHTLRGITANIITAAFITGVVIITLSEFIGPANLIWIIGLFSAAFGIGANQHVRDILTGVSFLFEDSMSIGEKVEIVGVEGVVENIYLRTTRLRAPTGELFTVPNGDVRVVRNFSRGRFSLLDITLKLASADLSRALPLLVELGRIVNAEEPEVLETWQILTPTGLLAQHAELRLLTKTRHGKAADLRPRLLARIHERLAEAEITLTD